MNKFAILLTRPNPCGAQLLCRVLSSGITALHYPALFIEPIPIGQSYQSDLLDKADWLIFTSPQAISYLPKITLTHQTILAIGRATAEALKQKNLPCHLIPEQENSEGLLAKLNPQEVENKQIVIIKGAGGRDLLASTLKQWGANVTCLDVYKRVINPTPLDAQILIQIHYIHVTSLEILNALLNNCPENQLSLLKQKTLLVSSQRLQTAAQELGFQRFILLANASAGALLEAISRLRS